MYAPLLGTVVGVLPADGWRARGNQWEEPLVGWVVVSTGRAYPLIYDWDDSGTAVVVTEDVPTLVYIRD